VNLLKKNRTYKEGVQNIFLAMQHL